MEGMDSFFYSGSYIQNGDRIEGQVKVVYHHGSGESIFGGAPTIISFRACRAFSWSAVRLRCCSSREAGPTAER
jgi:hypothetical protein